MCSWLVPYMYSSHMFTLQHRSRIFQWKYKSFFANLRFICIIIYFCESFFSKPSITLCIYSWCFFIILNNLGCNFCLPSFCCHCFAQFYDYYCQWLLQYCEAWPIKYVKIVRYTDFPTLIKRFDIVFPIKFLTTRYIYPWEYWAPLLFAEIKCFCQKWWGFSTWLYYYKKFFAQSVEMCG